MQRFHRAFNGYLGFCQSQSHGSAIDKRSTGLAAIHFVTSLIHTQTSTRIFEAIYATKYLIFKYVAVLLHAEQSNSCMPWCLSANCVALEMDFAGHSVNHPIESNRTILFAKCIECETHTETNTFDK